MLITRRHLILYFLAHSGMGILAGFLAFTMRNYHYPTSIGYVIIALSLAWSVLLDYDMIGGSPVTRAAFNLLGS